MATGNGRAEGPRDDGVISAGEPPRPAPPASGGGASDPAGAPRSGRGFVVVAGFLVAGITIALLLGFRQFLGQHQSLTGYGAAWVAPAVDPIVGRVPEGFTADGWRPVVAQTRAMLLALTASGAFDLPQMQGLRREIQELIAGTRPDTSAQALAAVWDRMEDRAGPVLTRHPRFGLASAARPLSDLKSPPPGIPPARWALAVVHLRALLAALGDPRPLPRDERNALRTAIDARLAAATPATARADLLAVWELARAARPLPRGFDRSALELPVTPPMTPPNSR